MQWKLHLEESTPRSVQWRWSINCWTEAFAAGIQSTVHQELGDRWHCPVGNGQCSIHWAMWTMTWAMAQCNGQGKLSMSNKKPIFCTIPIPIPLSKSLCRLQFVHFGFQISGLCFVRFEDLRWNSDKGFWSPFISFPPPEYKPYYFLFILYKHILQFEQKLFFLCVFKIYF